MRPLSGAGSPVFVDDPGEDDEERAGAYEKYPGARFAGMSEKDAKPAVESFDDEGNRKSQEQRIARVLPEAQKEDSRQNGGGKDDVEQESVDHWSAGHC